MPGMNGGDVIVEHLVKERVPYLFGVCGHGILGLLDAAFERRDAIKTITTHDERVAGFMADAYFRVAGRPVATYTSCGPGSLNLAMPVASAFMDSSPFLAITGNVATQQFNRGPFQETGRYFQGDFSSVMRPYVKRSYQAVRAEMLPLIMRQAYALMLSGRPGPVHVDVPLNVFVEDTDEPVQDPAAWRTGISTRGAGDPAAVAEIARLLLGAERPLIVAGNGVALGGAQSALSRFAELLQIPVVTSPLGKGTYAEGSHLALGATGRNGTSAANEAARNADVLLAIGTRFDDRATSAWLPNMTYTIPPTKLLHVDVDPQEIGRNYPPTVGVVGDSMLVLEQLIELCAPEAADAVERHASWTAEAAARKHAWEVERDSDRMSDAQPIHPERLLADVTSVLADDAIVLADVGVHHNWIVQHLKVPDRGRLLQSWGFAAMGFGVGGALGAQFAAPDRPVLSICGDGGFLMNANAVATAVEYELPVVWLVWNNLGYLSIRDQQSAFFGKDRELAVRFRSDRTDELVTSDFAAMASSMGANGVRVERPQDLREQLDVALASRRPTLLDVRVQADVAPLATGGWALPPLPPLRPSYTLD